MILPIFQRWRKKYEVTLLYPHSLRVHGGIEKIRACSGITEDTCSLFFTQPDPEKGRSTLMLPFFLGFFNFLREEFLRIPDNNLSGYSCFTFVFTSYPLRLDFEDEYTRALGRSSRGVSLVAERRDRFRTLTSSLSVSYTMGSDTVVSVQSAMQGTGWGTIDDVARDFSEQEGGEEALPYIHAVQKLVSSNDQTLLRHSRA